MIRWQRIGSERHATYSDHRPLTGETIYALCERRLLVAPGDRQQPDGGALCATCALVVTDMQP